MRNQRASMSEKRIRKHILRVREKKRRKLRCYGMETKAGNRKQEINIKEYRFSTL